MSRNLGDADRTVRMLLAAGLGVFFFFNHSMGPTTRTIVGLSVIYLLLTAMLGWCLFYAVFRISTTRPDDAAAKS